MNASIAHRFQPGRLSLLIVLAGAVIALLTAHGLERLLNLPPCDLCYTQRHSYWVAIAASIAGLVGRLPMRPLFLTFSLLGVVASGAVAGYHAGVEWQWWPGPGTCTGSGGLPDTLDGFNALLQSEVRVTACDEAPVRFFGLSLAGLNALYAAGLVFLVLVVGLYRHRTEERPTANPEFTTGATQ